MLVLVLVLVVVLGFEFCHRAELRDVRRAEPLRHRAVASRPAERLGDRADAARLALGAQQLGRLVRVRVRVSVRVRVRVRVRVTG